MELLTALQTLIRYLCRSFSDSVLDLRDHFLDFCDWVLGREVEIIEGPKPFLPHKPAPPANTPPPPPSEAPPEAR
jgi:hypothetical protein